MKSINKTIILVFFFLVGCKNMTPPVKAPFEDLDVLSINDWWNKETNTIVNLNVKRSEVIAFGIYTVSNNTLKLTAQLFPLYPYETREIRLEIFENEVWNEIQKIKVNDIGWAATFRINNWDSSKNIRYKIKHGKEAFFEGLIRKDPKNKNEIVLVALSCNSNKDREGRENYVKNINYINPDLLFFAGDQSYDHKEHTAAWIKFGMQFRETFRERPCITIPIFK